MLLLTAIEVSEIVIAHQLPHALGDTPLRQRCIGRVEPGAGAGPWDGERYQDGADNKARMSGRDDGLPIEASCEPIQCSANPAEEVIPALTARREGSLRLGHQVEGVIGGAVVLPGQAVGCADMNFT